MALHSRNLSPVLVELSPPALLRGPGPARPTVVPTCGDAGSGAGRGGQMKVPPCHGLTAAVAD